MTQLIRRPGTSAACLVLFCVLSALTGVAQAQWAWRDTAGNITYSDTPPPADIQPTNILQQPAPMTAADLKRATSSPEASDPGRVQGATGSAPAAPAAPAAPPPATRSLAEQDAEFRKRAAARQKAAQKEEEDEAQAKARAEACSQAKGYLQLIESGTRLMRPDAEGNRNYLDEEQRAAETQKAQDNIAKSCG